MVVCAVIKEQPLSTHRTLCCLSTSRSRIDSHTYYDPLTRCHDLSHWPGAATQPGKGIRTPLVRLSIGIENHCEEKGGFGIYTLVSFFGRVSDSLFSGKKKKGIRFETEVLRKSESHSTPSRTWGVNTHWKGNKKGGKTIKIKCRKRKPQFQQVSSSRRVTVTTSKANINPVVAVLESRERTSAFFALSAKIRKKGKEEKKSGKKR